MQRRLSLLALALILAGCGSSKATDPTPVSVPSLTAPAPVTSPAPGNTAAAPKPPVTVSDWNDKSFLAIQKGQWQEALTAAEQALKLDPNSSAGWFNKGRALLGAGKAREAADAFARADELNNYKNPDVKYYSAQAQEALKQYVAARSIYEKGMAQFPTDQSFSKALQALKLNHDTDSLTGAQADVDGDGVADRFVSANRQLQIISGKSGKVLTVDQFRREGSSADLIRWTFYPLRGATPIIQVEWACGTDGPMQHIMQYDKASAKFVMGDSSCASVQYMGDRRFEWDFRNGREVLAVFQRWDNGNWVEEGKETRTIGK